MFWSNLIDAAKDGNLDKVTALVEKGKDVNSRNKEGRMPLIQAAAYGHIDIVRFLIGNGADINAQDERGETALGWAVIEGHRDIVSTLLQTGTAKEVRDKSGFTPLMVAVIKKRVEIMRILLAAGADPHAKTPYGTTMEDCAEGDRELLDVLASATSKQGEEEAALPGFKQMSTPSPDVALSVLFEGALPATPLQIEPTIRAEHEGLTRSWGSQQLCEGDESMIRQVVHRNLRRISDESGFREFDVKANKKERCAQVNAIFQDSFVPVRLWRTSGKFFACGNSLFT